MDDYQKLLLDADRDQSTDLDKHVGVAALTLFPISASVCTTIAVVLPNSTTWLWATWFFAVIALVAVGVSKLTSQSAIRQQLSDDAAGLGDVVKRTGGFFGAMTHVFNLVAMVALTLAFCSLLVFGWKNRTSMKGASLTDTKQAPPAPPLVPSSPDQYREDGLVPAPRPAQPIPLAPPAVGPKK